MHTVDQLRASLPTGSTHRAGRKLSSLSMMASTSLRNLYCANTESSSSSLGRSSSNSAHLLLQRRASTSRLMDDQQQRPGFSLARQSSSRALSSTTHHGRQRRRRARNNSLSFERTLQGHGSSNLAKVVVASVDWPNTTTTTTAMTLENSLGATTLHSSSGSSFGDDNDDHDDSFANDFEESLGDFGSYLMTNDNGNIDHKPNLTSSTHGTEKKTNSTTKPPSRKLTSRSESCKSLQKNLSQRQLLMTKSKSKRNNHMSNNNKDAAFGEDEEVISANSFRSAVQEIQPDNSLSKLVLKHMRRMSMEMDHKQC